MTAQLATWLDAPRRSIRVERQPIGWHVQLYDGSHAAAWGFGMRLEDAETAALEDYADKCGRRALEIGK